MGFTKIKDPVSKFWNPNDRGQPRPNPVVCDSVLDLGKVSESSNAELTIYLKVWFEPVSVNVGQIQDADGKWFPVKEWSTAMDFPGWCRRVVEASNKTWDNKLILSLPDRYDGMDWQGPSGVWRPQVRCRFVCLVGDPKYYHCRVKVAVTDPLPNGEEFRCHSRVWSHVAGYERYKSSMFSKLGKITQMTACHEIGHLMGLPHIGRLTKVEGCTDAAQDNDNVCYASEDPNPSLARNIMGMGMDVTEFNGRPWKQELCKHANRDETFRGLEPDELWCSTDLTKSPTKR